MLFTPTQKRAVAWTSLALPAVLATLAGLAVHRVCAGCRGSRLYQNR